MAMTREQKKAAVDLAWATYRAESQEIPLAIPFSGYKRGGVHYDGFLEQDERLWRRYLAAERDILAIPEDEVPVTALARMRQAVEEMKRVVDRLPGRKA